MYDDRDPLHIKLGNPDLTYAAKHTMKIRLFAQNQITMWSQNYSLSANIYRNMFAYSTNYNTTTGVQESKVINVNGNWSVNAAQSIFGYLNSVKSLSFNNAAELFYVNSVDFMGENSQSDKRRTVRNFGVKDKLSMEYKKGNLSSDVVLDGSWHRYLSSMTGFSDFNAWNLNYGINGTYKLPANFEVSTDFMVYTRRGYSESNLNSDNFVWNVRVSYTIPKPGLTFIVDGFDLLNNLSNITYAVNAQARTETYRNVLPRYVLFHLQWKFNKSPKK